MPARYSRVAIWLHWSIAALMLPLFVSGPLMEDLVENRATLLLGGIVYALHKSLGLTVLALSLLRLGWRLANPPPPLPEATPRWQALAARVTHAAFYVVMIGAPLAGWALVSWSEVYDKNLYLSGRNVPKANLVHAQDINTYYILNSNVLVLAESAISKLSETLSK